jgi:hypothetical protein
MLLTKQKSKRGGALKHHCKKGWLANAWEPEVKRTNKAAGALGGAVRSVGSYDYLG